MTSTPLKDVSSIMNFVGQRSMPTSGTVGAGSGFGDAMSKASDKMGGGKQTEITDVTADRAHRQPEVRVPEEGASQRVVAEQKPTVRKTGGAEEAGITNEEAQAQMEAAGMEAVRAVAEELHMSEEELLAAMEELGMVPASLLDLQNLTQLVLAVSGEDASALVTNEGLYAKVSALAGVVTELAAQLSGETGLTMEELQGILQKAVQRTEETTGSMRGPEKLPEAEHTGNTVPEGEEEAVIIVEDDRESTVQTKEGNSSSKATETGAIQTESVTAEQTGEETGQQTSEQGRGQSTGTNQSLLEALLQNRIQSQTASVEEMMAAPAELPDTEQIMKQILDYMKIQLKPDMTQLEMQLHPESMGTLHIRIAATEGAITAQFTAQNEAIKAVLESQLVELKENLRSQGIKVEAVEVNVQSQSFDSNLWQGQEGMNQQYESNQRRGHRRINLNALDTEELPDDMTQEEQLAAEIMIENGSTVDFTA